MISVDDNLMLSGQSRTRCLKSNVELYTQNHLMKYKFYCMKHVSNDVIFDISNQTVIVILIGFTLMRKGNQFISLFINFYLKDMHCFQ